MSRTDKHSRKAIRTIHAELQEARLAASKVSRPDGTDESGHPGIRAANLEGVLGQYTIPLLDALEAAELNLTRIQERVQVAGVPAVLSVGVRIDIEGVDDPVLPPAVLQPMGGQITLVIDPRPAMEALSAALAAEREAAKEKLVSDGRTGEEPT